MSVQSNRIAKRVINRTKVRYEIERTKPDRPKGERTHIFINQGIFKPNPFVESDRSALLLAESLPEWFLGGSGGHRIRRSTCHAIPSAAKADSATGQEKKDERGKGKPEA
jgi:hypothetical protein